MPEGASAQPASPLLWAPAAWLDGRWQRDVLLAVSDDGHWSGIQAGQPAPPGAKVLAGPVLPGLVDAHSHAFQRAFAGLSEQRDSDADNFWSWRDRMYRVALRITPGQLQAIAAKLYAELLCGGYTQVCEFHYLHHRPEGGPHEDPLAMSWALCDAAAQAGTGLTMLPVLYERAGFTQPALRDDQRRFATDAPWVWRACEAVQRSGRRHVNAGVAIHSLRAASPESIAALVRLAEGVERGPIHIHIAEQQQEVDDAIAATGARPIAQLARSVPLDARWQLVHATHTVPAEIEAVARAGAGVVLCPGTEGNLGDGFADLPGWLAAGVPLTLGSDSHVTRAWPEELRWLEYGQRLRLQARNIAAAPLQGQPSTAARLFQAVLDGGAAAAGLPAWGLTPGARADLLVLDAGDDALLGLPLERTLDALVFSSPGAPIREVYVAGEQVVHDGRHRDDAALRAAFADAMHALWT